MSIEATNPETVRRDIARKQRIRAAMDERAERREEWISANGFFFEEDWRYMRYLVPKGKRVLDLGCGTGALLDALEPSEGVGIDFSANMVARAASARPRLKFLLGDVEKISEVAGLEGTFDFVLMSHTVGSLDDCWATFKSLHRYCTPETRIVVTYHAPLWAPLSSLYTRLSTGKEAVQQNALSSGDIANLLTLADFEVVSREWRMLSPFRLFGLGKLINRFVATLPLIRKLCLQTYVVARPRPASVVSGSSVTVVVPCRNERGNIESAITRLPKFSDVEVIYVEGGSKDGTWEEVQRVKAAYPHVDIKAFQQTGKGKGDAVRLGFAQARGDILMILDADLTMPPEDLSKYYDAMVTGKGEFINGSRLVYPMEKEAMRFLNLIANNIFALLFSYLLNQR
jgi:SAM-dependent methyltransferase